MIDSYKISQVIRNLVSNGLKFSKQGSCVEIKIAIVDNNDNNNNINNIIPRKPSFLQSPMTILSSAWSINGGSNSDSKSKFRYTSSLLGGGGSSGNKIAPTDREQDENEKEDPFDDKMTVSKKWDPNICMVRISVKDSGAGISKVIITIITMQSYHIILSYCFIRRIKSDCFERLCNLMQPSYNKGKDQGLDYGVS